MDAQVGSSHPPILQRGDRVYLAFPVSNFSDIINDMAGRLGGELTEIFAEQGVTVIGWSANTSLTAPVVVAIFRD